MKKLVMILVMIVSACVLFAGSLEIFGLELGMSYDELLENDTIIYTFQRDGAKAVVFNPPKPMDEFNTYIGLFTPGSSTLKMITAMGLEEEEITEIAQVYRNLTIAGQFQRKFTKVLGEPQTSDPMESMDEWEGTVDDMHVYAGVSAIPLIVVIADFSIMDEGYSF